MGENKYKTNLINNNIESYRWLHNMTLSECDKCDYEVNYHVSQTPLILKDHHHVKFNLGVGILESNNQQLSEYHVMNLFVKNNFPS